LNLAECYQILGVKPGASQKDIKNAYRRLSLQYHPDRNKEEKEGQKLKKVIEAYQWLRLSEKGKNRISENEVAAMYSDFWEKYDRTENEGFQFRGNFAEFRYEFGAKPTPDYEHNQEKESSPMSTHLILYGGLGAIALWIIFSSILK
jgi:molecular chaperone DnaJ